MHILEVDSNIYNLKFFKRKLEKEVQFKSKANPRKEIIKIRTKINESETQSNEENP